MIRTSTRKPSRAPSSDRVQGECCVTAHGESTGPDPFRVDAQAGWRRHREKLVDKGGSLGRPLLCGLVDRCFRDCCLRAVGAGHQVSDAVARKAGSRDDVSMARKVSAEVRALSTVAVSAMEVHEDRKHTSGGSGVTYGVLRPLRKTGYDREAIAPRIVDIEAPVGFCRGYRELPSTPTLGRATDCGALWW